MSHTTMPLKKLSQILCSKQNNAMFPNQPILFLVLIPFSGNHLSPEYGYTTTDDLLPHIKSFLHDTYHNNPTDRYHFLHECIYNNITGNPLPQRYSNGQRPNHFPYYPDYFYDIRSDINKRVCGSRPLPLYWIKEMKRNSTNISCLMKRLFWVLQYFFVYYSNPNIIINHALSTEDSSFVEYFILNHSATQYLYAKLKASLSDYSDILSVIEPSCLNLYQLCRIIVDILDAQCTIYQQNNNCKLPSPLVSHSLPHLSNVKQKIIFEQYIDIHAPQTLARYQSLEHYAKENYLACLELGTIYFYGEQFANAEDFTNIYNYIYEYQNFFNIKPDFDKALDYFLAAQQMTNPPSPKACWWIAQIYMNGLSTYGFDWTEAEKYFTLSGNYSPSYEGLGQIYLKKAREKYDEYLSTASTTHYDEALDLFVSAIELFDKSITCNWVYGYNSIARFLLDFSYSTDLIDTLSSRLHLSVPFTFESIALVALTQYQDPWLLTELASYYINNNRLTEAKPLLSKAIQLNYCPARYMYAMYFSSETSKIATLKYLSEKNYLEASYSLADIYYESKNYDLALYYINQADKQILTMRKLDVNLVLNIFYLKQLIVMCTE